MIRVYEVSKDVTEVAVGDCLMATITRSTRGLWNKVELFTVRSTYPVVGTGKLQQFGKVCSSKEEAITFCKNSLRDLSRMIVEES